MAQAIKCDNPECTNTADRPDNYPTDEPAGWERITRKTFPIDYPETGVTEQTKDYCSVACAKTIFE